MKTSERQSSTIRFMYGNWEYEGPYTTIKLTIQDFSKIVTLNIDGVIEEFDSGGHWFGDNHLCFYGPYYVRMANETNLIFGKHKSAVIGDYEWEYVFQRI